MRANTAIFDLDGTIADSAQGVERAATKAVAEVWPGVDAVALGSRIGPPLREMFEAAYPSASDGEVEALIRAFRAAYDGGEWRTTALFGGMDHVFESLAEARVQVFVATNKPHAPTSRILDHLGLTEHVKEAVSPDSPAGPFEAKARAIDYLLSRHRLDRARTVYVGDTAADGEAARAAGVRFVGVSFGYGEASALGRLAEAVAQSPEDLVPILLGERRAAEVTRAR